MRPCVAFLAGNREGAVLDALEVELLAIVSPAAKRELRDRYFRLVADQLGGATAWDRAGKLRAAADHFERHRWLAWRYRDSPPARASAAEALLWKARRLGAFPTSTRQFMRVLL